MIIFIIFLYFSSGFRGLFSKICAKGRERFAKYIVRGSEFEKKRHRLLPTIFILIHLSSLGFCCCCLFVLFCFFPERSSRSSARCNGQRRVGNHSRIKNRRSAWLNLTVTGVHIVKCGAKISESGKAPPTPPPHRFSCSHLFAPWPQSKGLEQASSHCTAVQACSRLRDGNVQRSPKLTRKFLLDLFSRRFYCLRARHCRLCTALHWSHFSGT